MGLSTHILDIALGRPAANVPLSLSQLIDNAWHQIGSAQTDADGRCKTLLGNLALEETTYELTFMTAPYFEVQQIASLYPYVKIVFTVTDPAVHYHIPLLISANGYSTYRGS
jgi:5-hydroxyisourate hydrolase